MSKTDSFACRVDKVFGSLGSGLDFSSPWRVSSQQQQPSNPFKPQPNGENDDDDNDEEIQYENGVDNKKNELELVRRVSGLSAEYRFNGNAERVDMEEEDADEGEDCREIRGMVGFDSTVDFEDEEDEFDRIAVGREDADSNRIYMKEMNERDYKTVSDKNTLPLSLYDLKKSARDPRANHMAAKARLEEDEREVTAFREANDKEAMDLEQETLVKEEENGDGVDETLIGSKRSNSSGLTSDEETEDKLFGTNQDMSCGNLIKTEQQNAFTHPSSANNAQLSASNSNTMANSVVKSQTSKRVRFQIDEMPSVSQNPGEELAPSGSQVPDYVRNPSKYSHYTLDWSVEDSDSWNFAALRACQEITNLSIEEEPCSREEKIVFIPRRERIVEEQSSSREEEIDTGNKNACQVIDPQSFSRNRMCVDDIDGGSSGEVNNADMQLNPEEVRNNAMKGARKYRAKKDNGAEMST